MMSKSILDFIPTVNNILLLLIGKNWKPPTRKLPSIVSILKAGLIHGHSLFSYGHLHRFILLLLPFHSSEEIAEEIRMTKSVSYTKSAFPRSSRSSWMNIIITGGGRAKRAMHFEMEIGNGRGEDIERGHETCDKMCRPTSSSSIYL